MVVLVTGASGQLGQSLQYIANKYPGIRFEFFSSSALDVTNAANSETVFLKTKPDYCINAAAYTAVDKAEIEPEKAFLINVVGARNIAKACEKQNTTLIHISTDFVFDGLKTTPYTEKDIPNPKSIYGQTKFDGEKAIQENCSKHFIIRTSWVYSQFANNFMKTMIGLATNRNQLSVVNDQTGSPTNAVDLAEAIVAIILKDSQDAFGIYNFSNEGQCSWYDFAKKIFEVNQIEIVLHPIPTKDYPTPAKRPIYSVLDKSKIKKTFNIAINTWEESLTSTCL